MFPGISLLWDNEFDQAFLNIPVISTEFLFKPVTSFTRWERRKR